MCYPIFLYFRAFMVAKFFVFIFVLDGTKAVGLGG